MTEPVRFTVYGTPKAKGSMRAFIVKGRPILTSTNKALKPWAQSVTQTAIAERMHMHDSQTAVGVDIVFWLARPASAKRRIFPTVKPDLDKFARAALDALTGVAFEDDSQVVDLIVSKRYGHPERTEFTIRLTPEVLAASHD